MDPSQLRQKVVAGKAEGSCRKASRGNGGSYKRGVKPEISSGDSEDTTIASSAKETSDGSVQQRRMKVKREPEQADSLASLNQRLIEALKRLDVRTVPDLELHEKRSGQSLEL